MRETLNRTTPSTPTQRLVAIDGIRGFAVLGILTMNIISIGLPDAARLNPQIAGGFEGWNRIWWWVGYLLFDEKMIALFAMLFGAGLVLQAERATQKGGSPAGLFYRRAAVLLLIGLVHAYLIWDGDILVTYALCGMLIYPFRRLSPVLLLVIGFLVMLPAIPFGLALSQVFSTSRAVAEKIKAEENQLPSVSDFEQARAWNEIRRSFLPTPAETAATIQVERQMGYLEYVQTRAPQALAVQTQLFVAAFLWLVGGRMLIGMALMKLGIFSGDRSLRFYLLLMLGGYGLGLPLVWLCGNWLVQRQFDPVAIFGGGLLANSFAGMLVALGHIGLVQWVFKTGYLTLLTDRLVAVGRMALTNYLAQSLICTSLFCGWGFGWIGSLDRTGLYALTLIIWLTQLTVSPLWLRCFQFGPAEWLWRTLTYAQLQPMRIARKA